MKHVLALTPDKDRIVVADVGCGPYSFDKVKFTNGLEVAFCPIDRKDFPGIEVQDMENLPYIDGTFDGVQCINALDHTPNAEQALKELIRISNDWVYIDLNLIQHTTSGKGHYWDALEDGTLTNGTDSFNLKNYGFEIKNIDFGGERRYNQIIATLIK